jgi:hypothetical protein
VPLIAGREVTGVGAARVRLPTADVELIHALDGVGSDGKPLLASPRPMDRTGIRPQKLAPRIAASVGGRKRQR